MEKKSRERDRQRAAGCVGKWDEKDAQPAAQAAAHANLWLVSSIAEAAAAAWQDRRRSSSGRPATRRWRRRGSRTRAGGPHPPPSP